MNKKVTLLVTLCSLFAIIGLIVAICAGAKSIPLQTVIDSIFHYEDILDMQLVTINVQFLRKIFQGMKIHLPYAIFNSSKMVFNSTPF